MKKTFIKRLATLVLFAMIGANLFSQGFYVYTKDGQRQDYASENVDSIVFYEKAVEDDKSDGDIETLWEAIDLGLSVMWATCNIGAISPEENGEYYAWGETKKKKLYDDENYEILNWKSICGSEYDVARAKWGKSWRMPTSFEVRELVEKCSWEWSSLNGKSGMLLTGPNGNHIFLPASGSSDYQYDLNINPFGFHYTGNCSEYWSGTSDNLYSNFAFGFGTGRNDCSFGTEDVRTGLYSKHSGYTVRPVFAGYFNEFTSGEAVDLGLSVKWSSCNLGAINPESDGGHYAWGEIEEKDNYNWENYSLCDGNSKSLTRYCTNNSYGCADNLIELEQTDDIAHVKWGKKWRIPTLDEVKELIERCTWAWGVSNGSNGLIVTGPNGNSIFFPASGSKSDKDFLSLHGTIGSYWTSTLSTKYNDEAGMFQISKDGIGVYPYYIKRNQGLSIRPVCD